MKELLDILHSQNFTGLCDDSRRVQKGNVFFSFPVENAERFALDAMNSGAIAIVGEGNSPQGTEEIFIRVDSVSKARVESAQEVYDRPFEKLKVHAVTGTNGKTTTAFLMREILVAAGKKVALLGTICNKINDTVWESSLTTPGLLDLYAFASAALQEGVTDLVMEASSHALHQGRMDGVRFASALFSNLTQDHLDYHKTMENYFLAKKRLFDCYLAKDGLPIINIDDSYGALLAKENYPRQILVSRKVSANADVHPSEEPVLNENGIHILVPKISSEAFESPLCGNFNVENILLILAWASALGISESVVRKALALIKVPGRFEKVYGENGKHIVVDYAHTPDALQRVLETARSLCQGKLSVVFGCGGDRDALKRPMMGAVAEKIADKVWVTSDNPRTENPKEIMDDIIAGMEGKFLLEENRALAILAAVSSMEEGDWLVVAGKGHENYQIIGTEKKHFSDVEEVLKAVKVC